MRRDLVSLIIPNFNGIDLVESLFQSIINQSYKDVEIIVVDNGSNDGSMEYVGKFQNVRLIANKRNLGFAKAINSGIKQSKGDFVLILNNDTAMDHRCIETLVSTFELVQRHSHNLVGLSPKILLDSFNRKFIDSIGIGVKPDGAALNRGIGQMDFGQYDAVEKIMGVCFAAAFIVKEAFEKIGYLDESYFAYYEDVDWCYRSNILGYEFYTCPKAIVYHKHSATAKRSISYSHKYYLIHRNYLRTTIRNYCRGNQLWSIRRALTYLHHAVSQLVTGSSEESLIHFRILTDTLVRLPKLLISNHEINKNRKVSDPDIWRLSSNPMFALGEQTFDPESYSPIMSVDTLAQSMNNNYLFNNENGLRDYLSLVTLGSYFRHRKESKVRARVNKEIKAQALTSNKSWLLIEYDKKRKGIYKISTPMGNLSLDALMTYILLESQNMDFPESIELLHDVSISSIPYLAELLNRSLNYAVNIFRTIDLMKDH